MSQHQYGVGDTVRYHEGEYYFMGERGDLTARTATGVIVELVEDDGLVSKPVYLVAFPQPGYENATCYEDEFELVSRKPANRATSEQEVIEEFAEKARKIYANKTEGDHTWEGLLFKFLLAIKALDDD